MVVRSSQGDNSRAGIPPHAASEGGCYSTALVNRKWTTTQAIALWKPEVTMLLYREYDELPYSQNVIKAKTFFSLPIFPSGSDLGFLSWQPAPPEPKGSLPYYHLFLVHLDNQTNKHKMLAKLSLPILALAASVSCAAVPPTSPARRTLIPTGENVLRPTRTRNTPLEKRSDIPSDEVVGFDTTVPATTEGTLMQKWWPYLKVVDGCVPFPAVDAEGDTR